MENTVLDWTGVETEKRKKKDEKDDDDEWGGEVFSAEEEEDDDEDNAKEEEEEEEHAFYYRFLLPSLLWYWQGKRRIRRAESGALLLAINQRHQRPIVAAALSPALTKLSPTTVRLSHFFSLLPEWQSWLSRTVEMELPTPDEEEIDEWESSSRVGQGRKATGTSIATGSGHRFRGGGGMGRSPRRRRRSSCTSDVESSSLVLGGIGRNNGSRSGSPWSGSTMPHLRECRAESEKEEHAQRHHTRAMLAHQLAQLSRLTSGMEKIAVGLHHQGEVRRALVENALAIFTTRCRWKEGEGEP